MNKRQFLTGAAMLGATASPAFAVSTANRGRRAASPVLLTVSGAISRHNRGAVDPALDQLFAKQRVKFPAAWTFDFAALVDLPAVTIEPTLEYDGRKHRLRGPLLTDVLKLAGAHDAPGNQIMMRAIDGYAAMTTYANAGAWKFIVATHLDGKPLALGALGPLWSVYDADHIAELAAKPLNERFESCPWGMYHIEVIAT